MKRIEYRSLFPLILAGFAIGMDFTGVMLLLPNIENSFGVNLSRSQWVLNAYALTYGVFMVAGGRIGDIYGRRRAIETGLVVFVASAAICCLAPSLFVLIAARAALGVGAALIWPNMLAAGSADLSDSADRGFVMGIILAGATTGNVFGPLLGGVSVDLISWRPFFGANAVMGLAAFFLVRSDKRMRNVQVGEEKMDVFGVACLSSALLTLFLALDAIGTHGWTSPWVLALVTASVLSFVAFPRIEARVSHPILPVDLTSDRGFRRLLVLNALHVPAIFVAFLYFPQFMQKALGWSGLKSSIGLAPMMVLIAVMSVASGALYRRLGAVNLLRIGYSIVVLGCLAVIFPPVESGYAAILPAMVFIACGGAMAVGAAGTATVGAVSQTRAGLAGGLSFMMHLLAGAIGVALATLAFSLAGGGESSSEFASGMRAAFAPAFVSALCGLLLVFGSRTTALGDAR